MCCSCYCTFYYYAPFSTRAKKFLWGLCYANKSLTKSLSHSVTHSLRCKHCGNKSFRTGPSMKPYWSTNHTYNNREALLLFILSIIDLNTTFQVNKNLMSSGTNLILRIALTVYDLM